MVKKKAVSALEKGMAQFLLVGKAQVNDDYTFGLDIESGKSDWIYNTINLGIDCGEECGTVYGGGLDGYGSERGRTIYAHGKKENGRDDFKDKIEIDWDDRFDDDILEGLGNMCFYTVGLEKNSKNETVYKKFLTQYDMIKYASEHLEKDMIVKVKGKFSYEPYNGKINCKKEITDIFLTKDNNFRAEFTQTVLLDRNSIGEVDKDKGVIYINGKVVDYIKEYNKKTIRGNVAFDKLFEFAIDTSDKDKTNKIITKLLKVKRGVTEITFEGKLIEGGALVETTMGDLPDDIREMVEIGALTEEEALDSCTVSGAKERRMVLIKPRIKQEKQDDDSVISILQKFDQKYDEEDIVLPFDMEDESAEEEELDDDTQEEANNDASEDDWLSKL